MNNDWHVVFDLHDVIADRNLILKNYDYYFINHLKEYGISEKKAVTIHRQALNNWLKDFIATNKSYKKSNPEITINQLKMIDKKYEDYIYSFLDNDDKLRLKKSKKFETSFLEYHSQVEGPYCPCFADVKAVISYLSSMEDIKIHLASSASTNHIKGVLTRCNIYQYFSSINGWNNVEIPKRNPNKDFFEILLSLLKIDPSKTIFVGDSIFEKQMADKINAFFIGIDRYNDINSPNKTEKNSFVKNLYSVQDKIVLIINY